MDHPPMRASDDDRDRTVAALREHLAVGRLSMEEFETRMTSAYEAVTLEELDGLTADLPRASSAPAVVPSSEPARRGIPNDVRAWLGMSVLLTGIWGLTSLTSGELGYFWPMWVIGPVGLVLLVRWISGRTER